MFGTIGLIGYLMQIQEGFMFLAFLVLFLFYVYVSQVLSKSARAVPKIF